MSLLMQFRRRVDQHIDTFFVAQAVDGQDEGAMLRQVETPPRLLVEWAGPVAREVYAIGNSSGGSAQSMLVEQFQRRLGGGRHIFTAIAEMHKVSIPHVLERLPQDGIERDRAPA